MLYTKTDSLFTLCFIRLRFLLKNIFIRTYKLINNNLQWFSIIRKQMHRSKILNPLSLYSRILFKSSIFENKTFNISLLFKSNSILDCFGIPSEIRMGCLVSWDLSQIVFSSSQSWLKTGENVWIYFCFILTCVFLNMHNIYCIMCSPVEFFVCDFL